MNTKGVGAGALLRMSGGAFVWVSAFVWLYAGHSLGCQNLHLDDDAGLANPVTLTLIAIAVIHGAAMAWLWVRWLMRPVTAHSGEPDASHRFRHRVEGLVLGTCSAALLFLSFPLLMATPCVG